MIKPARLRAGDSVALLSTSWGGPHVFPHVFDAGVDTLTSLFGLRVREGRTTRWSPEALRNDPRSRATDLNEAFADPSVAAIFYLTIVTNMDFGHIDPQWIIPLGIRAELDPNANTFRLLESAVQ